jgi:MFS transporter, DHA3 family, macrolide efflux protein
MEEALNIEPIKKERLWTKNFLLLWQGQFVSGIGDIVYEIALGFWVLAFTGDTFMMSALMAATMAPRVIISPIAGVFVDKSDRKKLMVMLDLIRGVFVVFVGVAAIMGFIQLWMVFVAGIAIGTCGSFFSPASGSTLPDIVPKSMLMKANGALSVVQAGSNILGSAIGGTLFKILGAPVLFLFNGISYLVSAFSIMFMDIPKLEKEGEKVQFKKDFMEGLSFVWNFKGLRYLMIIACIVNYLASIAMTLFIPFFYKNPSLGVVKYGYASAILAIGMLLGMVFATTVNIKPKQRLRIFAIASVGFSITFGSIGINNNFYFVCTMLLAGGFFNALVNVFIQATMQQTVPQDKRGKVFALLSSVSMGLIPIAMLSAGVLSKLFSLNVIFIVCFTIIMVIFIPFTFNGSFKKFINFDPDTQTIEDII